MRRWQIISEQARQPISSAGGQLKVEGTASGCAAFEKDFPPLLSHPSKTVKPCFFADASPHATIVALLPQRTEIAWKTVPTP
jgi:hypothetical protein